MVLLLITVSLSGYVNGENEKVEDIEDISAKEGLQIAEEAAMEWNADSILVYVMKSSTMINEGTFSAWGYKYWNETSNECLGVKAYGNGTVTTRETGYYKENPIYNWNIDSDEAYEIAIENDEIQEYLSTFERAYIERFTLFGGEGDSDPTWKIHWSYSGGIFRDPKHAEIRINARNGEVVGVGADEGEAIPGFTAPLLLLAVIITAAIYKKRNR